DRLAADRCDRERERGGRGGHRDRFAGLAERAHEIGDAIGIGGTGRAALEGERWTVGERQRRADEADVIDREARGTAIEDLGGGAKQRLDRGARTRPRRGRDARARAVDHHGGLSGLRARTVYL